jgi:hypothetical protein
MFQLRTETSEEIEVKDWSTGASVAPALLISL